MEWANLETDGAICRRLRNSSARRPSLGNVEISDGSSVDHRVRNGYRLGSADKTGLSFQYFRSAGLLFVKRPGRRPLRRDRFVGMWGRFCDFSGGRTLSQIAGGNSIAFHFTLHSRWDYTRSRLELPWYDIRYQGPPRRI